MSLYVLENFFVQQYTRKEEVLVSFFQMLTTSTAGLPLLVRDQEQEILSVTTCTGEDLSIS